MRNRAGYSFLFMFLTIFLINILPLYVFSIYSYSASYNTTRNLVVESMQKEIRIVIDNLISTLEGLSNRQYECTFTRSSNILALPDVSAYTRTEIAAAKLNVQDYIRLLNATNRIVSDITVYYFDTHIKISSVSGIDALSDEDRAFAFSKFNNLRYNMVDDGSDFFMVTGNKNIYMHGDAPPNIVVISRINHRNILNMITSSLLVNNAYTNVILQNTLTGGIITTDFDASLLPTVKGTLSASRDSQYGYYTAQIDGEAYLTTYFTSPELGFTLYEYMPQSVVFKESHAILRLMQISLVFFVAAILMFYFISRKYIYRPTAVLVDAFKQVREHDFSVKVKDKTLSREFLSMYEGFNEMMAYVDDLVQKNYTGRILAQEAQLKQLQFQINPHFLYNSFFIISSMVRTEDYDSVEKMTALMGTYLKYITYDTREDVPLSSEHEHAYIYAQIQQLRFKRRLRVEMEEEAPLPLKDVRVPKILLQPLLENSFLHGMKNVSENGVVRVRYELSEGRILIHIEDNGDEIDDNGLSEIQSHIDDEDLHYESKSIALMNINKRLKLRFGEESGLYATRSDLGGLKMTVAIITEEGADV